MASSPSEERSVELRAVRSNLARVLAFMYLYNKFSAETILHKICTTRWPTRSGFVGEGKRSSGSCKKDGSFKVELCYEPTFCENKFEKMLSAFTGVNFMIL
jgi:hypothetical protein